MSLTVLCIASLDASYPPVATSLWPWLNRHLQRVAIETRDASLLVTVDGDDATAIQQVEALLDGDVATAGWRERYTIRRFDTAAAAAG